MDHVYFREIFAQELESRGERRLAEAVRDGSDNSHGGLAAIAAMARVSRVAVGVSPEAELTDRAKKA